MIRHSNNSNKVVTTWVVHASAWWSIPRYEQDRNKVGVELEKISLALLSEIEQKQIKIHEATIGHRWGMSRCV